MRLKKSEAQSYKLFSKAHRLVSPSVYMVRIFENYGYSGITYIPNTIEIKNYTKREKEFTTIDLLWVRSFSSIYNPLLALEVLKQLLDLGHEAKLCMVGPDKDGSLAKAKQFASDYNLPLKFTGKLSKNEWIELAKNYNVFINTTNFDNMPVSVIEAMALGLPLVSTNVGGMPDLIEDSKDGLLVPPNDPKAMVEAILRLHTNSSLAHQMARDARKKVERFDWEIVKLKWMEILR